MNTPRGTSTVCTSPSPFSSARLPTRLSSCARSECPEKSAVIPKPGKGPRYPSRASLNTGGLDLCGRPCRHLQKIRRKCPWSALWCAGTGPVTAPHLPLRAEPPLKPPSGLAYVSTPGSVSCSIFQWGSQKRTCSNHSRKGTVLLGHLLSPYRPSCKGVRNTPDFEHIKPWVEILFIVF